MIRALIIYLIAITAILNMSCPTPTASPIISATPTPAAPKLMINEIDYDNSGTDDSEFIEIYNAGGATNLSGYSLVLVNGAGISMGSVYSTIDLTSAGTIAAGQYLVIGSDTALLNATTGSLKISLGTGSDYIQNGTFDGLALVKASPITLIDAFSYEGTILSVNISGLGTVSLAEGAALSASITDSNSGNGSLCRNPNGSDTNNSGNDWAFSTTITPGAANTITP